MTRVTEEEGKVIRRRTHSRIGFLGIGGGDRPHSDDAPNWIWLILGTFALGAILFAAVSIATREPPFGVPGASPIQANLADSLHKALRKDSLNVAGHIRLANLLYDTQNYERAIPYYRTVLRLDPGETDARVDLAVALHQSGHTGEAVSELKQVLAENPDHAIAWFDLGVIYEFMGDLDGAEEAYLTAVDLDVKPELAHAIDQRLREVQSKKEATP
jgi:tetratricopeptide (TPR) repeat protein